MSGNTIFGGIGVALSHQQYRLYFITNLICTIGRWIYRSSAAWFTWQLTGSYEWLGIIAFADIFPMVLLSMFAGALSDRIGYMRVIRATQLFGLLLAILLSVLILGDWIDIWVLLGITILHGCNEAISTPPRVSIVNALVPKEDLSAAIGLNSAQFNASRVVGPAIGGSLLLFLNAGWVFAIAALTFIQFYVALFFIRTESGNAGGQGKLSFALMRDMWDGVTYAWNDIGIRFLLALLALTGFLVRPFMELAPGFADKVFGMQSDGMAIILSSIGAGGLVGALSLARRGQTAGLTNLVTWAVAIQSAALILFTMTDNLFLGSVFLFVVGLAMLITGVGSQTLIQNTVDAAVRARVMSLFVMLSWGLPALGAWIEGAFAEYFGLQFTVGVGAFACLLVGLWSVRVGKKLSGKLEFVEKPA
ncbi:MAG: MFS transporter [Rhodospirillaceae bacterium]